MTDYLVDARSDTDIRRIARDAIRELGISLARSVDLSAVFDATSIRTVFGLKRLVIEELDDLEMGPDDGRTSFAKRTVSIQLRTSVARAARSSFARARMTVAHELGHAYLHQGPTLYRKLVEPPRPAFIDPPRSAEHQAKVFASSFLMPDDLVAGCLSAAEIAAKCTVSDEAARIRFDLLDEARRRRDNAQRMRSLAQELRADPNISPPTLNFLPEPCPACGHSTVFPVGCKFMCKNCDRISDSFQDGDSV